MFEIEDVISSQGSSRPHCKGGCYRCPTRTQHHRTLRPGISILRKSRTIPVPRAPALQPSRSHPRRPRPLARDNFITPPLSRSRAATVGVDVANCY
ncbi:hypothetical protein JYU34_000714 [Plutella xylostella]|uniref:Uncharacterized protein n=1 Tax=Plutella xylostella TaxID=51655 RepID=A0ABQ7R8C7_PLUXY|nr:hypothetical protein JYU34_000714 [Plutella xylostella]